MNDAEPTPAGAALTELILAMFRSNNVALAWGDRLVGKHGLTSARWQILGAIASEAVERPVAQLARDLGASRQNVQRIVNDLERDGLLRFEANPSHRRSQLVAMTEAGRNAYRDALAAYYPQVNIVAEAFSIKDLVGALRILSTLTKRLGDTYAEE